MQMTIASVARWIALVGLALQASAVLAHAEPIFAQIGIQVADNNVAVKRCADELIKRGKSSPLVPKGLRVAPLQTVLDQLDKQRDSGRSIPPFLYVSDKSHEFDLIKVPFVFRDAEHVLAFLRSGELYRKIRDNPTQYWSSQQRLAIAYGGFFQMFSKAAAVTEPKHFYGRFIGGTVREPELYRQFGAYMNPYTAITGMFAGLDARGADDMSRDDRMTQIVEAHLASAIENGFKGKGRFVNLVSSSMLAVDILVWKGSDEISPENMAALRNWAEEAAAACSEANYQKELEVLEALKADGYQIVPFNRRALVERSWSTSLENRHAYWTIEQFDMLARLGKFQNGGLLPSALFARMTAQKRKEALNHDNEAKHHLEDAIQQIARWEQERAKDRSPPEPVLPPVPASDGEKLFNRCRACHQVGETARNALGPHLNGLFGRKVASAQGFNYSDAIKTSRMIWSEATFASFLKNPKVLMPNKTFSGFPDERQVQALIQYLKQFRADGKRK